MKHTFKIVKIDYKYCNYLRNFDNKIPYNEGKKELRPFVGILFTINNVEYFAPLTSPKPKHLKMKNTVDFLKIDNGKLGAINFNNMLPVSKKHYSVINVNVKSKNQVKQQYLELLKDQLNWLNLHYLQICNKSLKLYNLYNQNKLTKNIKARCCNFKLLEEKCLEYNKEKIAI